MNTHGTKLFTLTAGLLVASVTAHAVPTIVLSDGFEAAENLADNGWTGSWSFSNSTFGNPGNYAFSGDAATISKDTGYVIQTGDLFNLNFDVRKLESTNPTGGTLTASLYFDDGLGIQVLGSVQYSRTDLRTSWGDTVGTLVIPTIVASDDAVGENLLVSFNMVDGSTASGNVKRIGIDNVSITDIPEPNAAALITGCFGLASVMLRRRRD